MIKYFSFLVILLLALGCNCDKSGYGYVFNYEDNAPMSGVEISIYLSSVHDDTLSKRIFTDENGYFKVEHQYCKNHMIYARTEGFYGHVFKMPQGDTILMQVWDKD